jgi:hypothetical protein
MHHQEFSPPLILQDAIKCFWYNRRDSVESESSFEVQPDGYAEIIFYFGNLSRISPNGDLQSLPSPFMIGLLNQPVVFYTKNRLDIIAIRCFPWTVFDLLGLPSGKDGVRIFEHPVAQLQSTLSKLIEAEKIDEAIDQVKQYFLNAQSRIAIDSMLFKAGVAMKEAKGIMPVNKVATAAHATIRYVRKKVQTIFRLYC